MKSELKAGAILSYVALFLNSGVSIIYTPIMLNLLGQSEYGLYSLASSVVGYLGVLNFGLGNAVIRYTARYKALNDEEGCAKLYGMFWKMYGILGILAFIAGTILTLKSELLFSNSLSIAELHKLKILIGIMVFNISIGIGLGIFSVIVLANEKFIFQKFIGIIGSIINPLVILPLLLLGYGSIAMVIVSTLINFITILVNIYYCFKVLKIKIVFSKFEANLLKEIIGFSVFIFLNLIIDKIYWSTDQVILGMFSGTIAVSIYSVGASFTGYFSGFSSAISNVFLSKVSRMVTKEVSHKEISDLFIRIGRIQYIIVSFALSGFIVFGQEFIDLWVGKDYHLSFTIALLILVPMIIPLIQSMGGIILQAKNMQGFKTIVYFIIAVANVILSVVLVQWWGAVGCAIATALAFTIGNIIVMNFYYWKKINIDIPMFWKNIFYMSVPLALSIGLGISINKIFLSNGWFLFIVKVIIFSVIYCIFMWFIGMNKYEKCLIKEPFKNIFQRLGKGKLYKVS